MALLVHRVQKILRDDGWPLYCTDDPEVLTTVYQGENSIIVGVVNCSDEEGLVAFYAFCPMDIPEDRRTDVALFLTRANYALWRGNFEMDLDSGEIRFKTSMETGSVEVTPRLVRDQVDCCFLVMDRYLVGIAAVVHREQNPLEAIKAVEGDDE